MELTPESPTPSKRRRFSTDNPFRDSDDTESSYEIPQKKKSTKLSPAKKNHHTLSTIGNTITQDEDVLTDTNQMVELVDNNNQLPNKITFNGTFDDFDFNVSTTERDHLVADFNKAMTRFKRGDPDIEGIEEIEKTLDDLRPLNGVIYVYVRFARQLPSTSFHSDSLCSLLCVTKHCSMKPSFFITNVQSLEVRNNKRSKCGLSFSFVTRNTKDVDGASLEKKFLGLKYTLKLLQSTVANSRAIIGNANGDSEPPPTKCSCLYTKLWQGIGHRWLAYHIVDHLFSLTKASSWTNQEIFLFSIRVFAPCGNSRYDFLNPLVGFCLQFNNHSEIDLHLDQLNALRADPNLFYSYGNTYLHNRPSAIQIQRICETFSSLNQIVKRKKSYRTLELDSKWLLLKAYTYHLWLQNSRNNSIKMSVLKMLVQSTNHQASQGQNIEVSSTTPSDRSPSPLLDRKMPPASKPPAALAPQQPAQPPAQQHTQQPAQPPAPPSEGGLQLLLQSRNKELSPRNANDPRLVPPTGTRTPTDKMCLSDLISSPTWDWNNIQLLSTTELNEIIASYLIIRRDDGIQVVQVYSKLSPFEIYSADNLHKHPHCRVNGPKDFSPHLGQLTFGIGNEIQEYIDIASKTLHIAREASGMCEAHGDLVPSIHHIAALCQAVIIHGSCDEKRCPGQHRAFIGNGGRNMPKGIPTILVDGGFRKKIARDKMFCLDQILPTIGRLSEFLWRTMVDMQRRAQDSPMAPDRVRHSAYANHLCHLLSMDECVSFEHIVFVVSMIYPTTSDLLEHVDVMNDTAHGYTRTGTLNICLVIKDANNNSKKAALKLQVIGTFRRVIGQYMERTRTLTDVHNEGKDGTSTDPHPQVQYQPLDSELSPIAHKFGQYLRSQESSQRILFEGRRSRTSFGSQSYTNSYTPWKTTYTLHRFKVATFGDVEYARRENIVQMKVLGHMETAKDVNRQVNSFNDYESGKELLDYLSENYGNQHHLANMRSASYHQQIMKEATTDWTIFEGHLDKNFVHTAWFVPLTGATFYTFLGVPNSWNIEHDQNSEMKYREWVYTRTEDDRNRLRSFEETFRQQAKVFMKASGDIQVLIYLCTLGSFLAFPANLCYHATLSIPGSPHVLEVGDQMKDILVVYPMESG